MAGEFTSWSALRTSLLDALATNPLILIGQSFLIAGRTIALRSIPDIEALLALCDRMIAEESRGSSAPFFSRVKPV